MMRLSNKLSNRPGNKDSASTSWQLLAAVALLLSACGGNYQAPVADQGEQQRISAPIIVDSSTPDSSFNAPTTQPRISSSNAVVNRSSAGASSNSGATSNQSQNKTHRVSRGDTLFKIAFQYDLDFRSLAIANELRPPYTIFVDQVLNLDVSRVATRSSLTSTLGTAVTNNSVARAQASSSSSGRVLRQPIGSTANTEPRWQWPHSGRVMRGFQADINKGIDIGGLQGSAVQAASDGDVVYSGREIQGSGDLIIIRHSDRYLSAYAHNSAMLVSEGDKVRAGQKIAEVGENPAGVTMLHFEIRMDGKSVDPASYLPAR